MRTTPLHRQISDVFERTKWSVQQFLNLSELDLERSSLDRKLKGELRMNTDEAEVLVDTLCRNGFPLVLVYGEQTSTKKTRRAA